MDDLGLTEGICAIFAPGPFGNMPVVTLEVGVECARSREFARWRKAQSGKDLVGLPNPRRKFMKF